jgi:hypothetical protein
MLVELILTTITVKFQTTKLIDKKNIYNNMNEIYSFKETQL